MVQVSRIGFDRCKKKKKLIKLIKLIKVHLMACQKASSTNSQVSIFEGHIASHSMLKKSSF